MRNNSGLFLRVMICLAVVFSSFQNASFAQNAASPDKIKSAINSSADYAADVLLDKSGQSRCEYYMLEGKWYPYEPAWHTGQIILALTEAYKITGNRKYLENAKRAGEWWTNLQIKDCSRLDGMMKAIHGSGIEYICFATVTDGSHGLFNLWKITGDEKYASVPTTAGKWMLNEMYIPEHRMFYDFVDPNTGLVLKDNSPFWPDKKNQVLTDVSRPNNEGSLFLDMYEYTKDEKYKKVFIDLCESLVEKQGPEGLWMQFTPNDSSDGSIHPRFNIWYAESLVNGYELTGDKRFLDAAKKTMKFYKQFQKKDGVIYYTNFLDGRSSPDSPCGSVVAFAGIVWLRLYQLGAGEEFKLNISRSLDWILSNSYSVNHPDPNLRGATLNLRTKNKPGGMRFIQRDIGTSFALRFLCDYHNFISSGGKL